VKSPVSAIRHALVSGAALAIVIGAPAAQAATTDQSVSVDAFAFTQADATLPVGARLTWTNAQNGVPHTATSLDGIWDSGVLSTNDTFGFTFDQTGDFAYECSIHPSMRGIVHVVANADAQ
jgi:plastocyanin